MKDDRPKDNPAAQIQLTEQDRDQMAMATGAESAGEPGKTGDRVDMDMDDSQLSGTSTHPVYGRDT